MLNTIKIKNFALIENAEIPFAGGLNVLSGETGAGKSIILEAISLLLGGRANSDGIRHGADEAIVEGLFDTESLPWVAARMKEVGLESSEANHELLIKRSISKSGKNRIFINGEIATLHMLQVVTDGLVDLCGQNEHQSLFKSSVQLALLDRYARLDAQFKKAQDQFLKAHQLKLECEQLKRKEDERVQRLDFIQFQVKELNEANLSAGEDEQLLEQKKLLQSVEQRRSAALNIDSALTGDDHDALLQKIKFALKQARLLLQLDPGAQALADGIERANAELEEAARLIGTYVAQIESSPEDFNTIQERLSLITNMKRKYGQNVDEILSQHQKLLEEMDLLENLSSRLEGLETELNLQKKIALQNSNVLFQARQKGAEVFSKAVVKELKELRMSDSVVELALAFTENFDQWGPDSLGTTIDFLVQPNLGEEKRSIQKIVSGGELSRLMLAIRRVISDRGGIGVYLFDEIDAGLGGQTAFTVGKKLKSVAQHNQVICITHVPQVACFADHHLSISKKTQKGRTLTTVEVLDLTGRREEVARMLGSEKITPAAIKNARDLMDSARL
jgi:DNA repair protein RecN (Recombination protein N)